MKIKVLSLAALLILLSSKILGQGFTPTSTYFNDDVWFFGTTGVGIQFKNGVPQDFSGVSKVAASENSLSVSTPACDGGFVFYTSHSYVYNSQHKPMKGGIATDPATNPGYFYGHNSVADGLAACYIGDNKYFLISSTNAYEAITPTAPIRLYYYTVDMNGDNGMGELSNPVQLESTGMSESVEIVPIPNKYNEYWLIYNHIGRQEMTVCKITPSGITRQESLCIKSFNAGSTYHLKRSPLNDRLALASPAGSVYIFNFNPTTGVLEYKYSFATGVSATYGVEFSPNGQYLFAAGWNNPNIAQFQLGAASATKVSSGVYQPTSNGGGGIKLAPDGKIYVMRNIGGNYLGVISTPNQVVNFSNTTQYNPNGFQLSANYGGLSLSTGLTPPGIDPPGNNQAPQPHPDYATTTNKTAVTVAVVANDIDPNKADPNDKSGLFLTAAEFLNTSDTGKGAISYNEVDKTVTFTPNTAHNFTDGEQIIVKYRLRNNGIPVGLCSDDGRLTITIKSAKLSWSTSDVTIEEGGSSATLTVCMPENTVAPSTGLSITLDPQVSSTATAADYAIAPGLTATIPAGQSCTSFMVQANTDLFVEGEEKLILVAKATNFIDSPAQTATIIDKTPGDIVVEKCTPTTGDASEPATHGSFRIYFKEPNVVCTKPTTVNFSLSGSAQNSVDFESIPLSVVIPSNTHEITVPVTVKDNFIVQGVRDVKITLESAIN